MLLAHDDRIAPDDLRDVVPALRFVAPGRARIRQRLFVSCKSSTPRIHTTWPPSGSVLDVLRSITNRLRQRNASAFCEPGEMTAMCIAVRTNSLRSTCTSAISAAAPCAPMNRLLSTTLLSANTTRSTRLDGVNGSRSSVVRANANKLVPRDHHVSPAHNGDTLATGELEVVAHDRDAGRDGRRPPGEVHEVAPHAVDRRAHQPEPADVAVEPERMLRFVYRPVPAAVLRVRTDQREVADHDVAALAHEEVGTGSSTFVGRSRLPTPDRRSRAVEREAVRALDRQRLLDAIARTRCQSQRLVLFGLVDQGLHRRGDIGGTRRVD